MASSVVCDEYCCVLHGVLYVASNAMCDIYFCVWQVSNVVRFGVVCDRRQQCDVCGCVVACLTRSVAV